MKQSVRLAWLACLALSPLTVRAEPAFDAASFDKTVAPLLAERCLNCHSGPKPKGGLDLSRRAAALKGGESGPALVPGKIDESLLWQYVESDEMPPKKPLAAAERKLFKDWIVSGATWGSDPIDPFRYTTAARAGYDWWSLQPVKRPAVPQSDAPQSPIDAFVAAKLAEHGLRAASEADPRTLIRRVTFDLTGLPPTPEEVEAFVREYTLAVETRSKATAEVYEALVDKLLASPQYGERWARHWLDVVRFGESNGFERDLPRFTAWHYRNWVAQALNADLPYDEFARRQLAGDVLYPDDADAVLATGFLVAGPHDTVIPASEAMIATMRQDELEDIVGTVGQTFLGLTVNCARCHDHKFDPITAREYYQLASCLGGVEHGDRDVTLNSYRERIAQTRTDLDQSKRRLTQLEEPVRAEVLADRKAGRASPSVPPLPLAAWDFTKDLRDQVGSLHGTKFHAQIKPGKGLELDGRKGYVETTPLADGLAEKTLEAWVKLDTIEQRGGAVIGVQSLDGVLFDAIVFAERQPKQWMAGSSFFKRTKELGGIPETEADKRVVHLAIAYHADGTIAAYRDGRAYGTLYKSSGPAKFEAGQAQVVFGLRHSPPGGNKMLGGTIVRARLYDRALSDNEVAASAGAGSDYVADTEIVARLSKEHAAQRQKLQADIARLTSQLAKLESQGVVKAYTVTPKTPPVGHVLRRGNAADLGEVVSPGGIQAIVGARADFGIQPDASDADRRVHLARWITDQRNPLFARTLVNRLWLYHFGAGLVDTPNDLGFNGGRPSHPELLEWLASELVARNWSLKALHRLIVTSATYRQSPTYVAAAARLDASNRWLWHKSPVRLEAGVVRDAMLAVSGKLDRTIGGRGYADNKTYFFKGTQFYEPMEQVGSVFYRRTLYRMWARGGRSPLLDTLDCPDPSTPTPKRAVTTTPLQALALMNNSFVLHMADCLAERIESKASEQGDARVTLAYRLVLQRAADLDELGIARPFVAKHGLAAFCRVLFNSNEFVYVD